MRVTKLFLLFLIILIVMPLAFANQNYTQIGGEGFDFALGSSLVGDFVDNVNCPTENCASRGLVAARFAPLVADMDGSGTNNIAVLDSDTVRLYESSSLTIVDNFPLINGVYSNPLLYDIDDDNFIEYIIMSDTIMYILEYNGTHFFNDTSYATGITHTDGDLSIACRGPNDCLLTSMAFDDDGHINNYFRVTTFNSTHALNTLTLLTEGNTANNCLAGTRIIEIADYNNDGDEDYIFSVYRHDDTLAENISIFYIDVNSSSHPTLDFRIGRLLEFSIAQVNCAGDRLGRYITEPLVYDFDGGTGNGLETVFGVMKSDNEYKVYMYSSTGALLRTYPSGILGFDGDGEFVSNIARMNVFEDTGVDDFCVMGHDDDETDEIEYVCGSFLTTEGSGFNDDFVIFEADLDDWNLGFNNTINYAHWRHLIHGVDMSSRTVQGFNPQEILNTYGVWLLDWDVCLVGICQMELLYENPAPSASALISVDVGKTDKNDLLALTTTALFYLDDGFENSRGEVNLELTEIDPCTDHTWKVNTTVDVILTCTDPDGDTVQGRAVLYGTNLSGMAQDSGWSVNTSSNLPIPFGFIANETRSSDSLILYCRDPANHPDNPDVRTVPISVGTTGVENGDCSNTLISLFPDVVPETCETDNDCPVNYYCNSTGGCELIGDIPDIGDEILDTLNLPHEFKPLYAFFALIIAVLGTVLLMIKQGVKDGAALIYVPVAVGIVTLGFVTWMKWIPGWIIAVSIVLGAAIIGWEVHISKKG